MEYMVIGTYNRSGTLIRQAVRIGSVAYQYRECDGPVCASLADARKIAKEWNADRKEITNARR